MRRLVNALKSHALQLDAQVGQPRFGLISSVDKGSGTAKVMLQPENILTGWLPMLAPWVGVGWGMFAPPPPGTQVALVMQEGDIDNGIILGPVWSNAARPPGAGDGEAVIRHTSGSQVHLASDGTVTLQDPSGTSMKFTNNGTLLVTGNLMVSGDVSDNGGVHGSVASLRNAYDPHTHVDSRGGTTSGPSETV